MKEAAIRFRKERLFLLPRVGEKRWINSSAKRRELFSWTYECRI